MNQNKLPGISIIVSNYNGKHLLERFLPSVVTACKTYLGPIEIIIADDSSTDESYNWIKKNHPEIRFIKTVKNSGFASNINNAVKTAKYKIVLVLNNDIELKSNAISFLPEYFSDPSIFAVRLKSIVYENNKPLENYHEWIRTAFKHGMLQVLEEPIPDKHLIGKPFYCYNMGGGTSAFDRDKFNELGGYDELFNPFYWEDVDLSHRAWKRGWKIICEPRAINYHHHRSTISKNTSKFRINSIGNRNRFLFMWKNLHGFKLIFLNIIFIPLTAIFYLFKNKLSALAGLYKAFLKLRVIYAKRKEQIRISTVSDSDLLNFFSEFRLYNKDTEKLKYTILFIDDWGTFHGGGQTYLFNLLSHIDRRVVNPVFIAPDQGTFACKIESLGINSYYISKPRIYSIWQFFYAITKIYKICKNEEVSLIHCNSSATFLTLAALIAARMLKLPSIWQIHVSISSFLMDKIIVHLATSVVSVSSFHSDRRLPWLKNSPKLAIIPNGVDTNVFSPNMQSSFRQIHSIDKHTLLIGTMGQLHSTKGQQYLIKAFVLLKEKYKNIKLIIAGKDISQNGEFKTSLTLTAQKENISDNVIFIDWTDQPEDVISAFDIAVIPSVIDHFPLSLLEAMSCGKPVIATKVGHIPRVIENMKDGILVDPSDYASLAKAIETLLNNKSLRSKIAINARNKVLMHYSIKNNAKHMESLYRNLLKTDL